MRLKIFLCFFAGFFLGMIVATIVALGSMFALAQIII